MNREKHLETILVLVLALGILFWVHHSGYYLIAAGILCIIGVFIPYLAQKIHWAWMKLAHFMGLIMGKVMLTIVYVVFLLPLSFFSKLFKTKTGVVLKKTTDSYYTKRDFTYTKDSIENVW